MLADWYHLTPVQIIELHLQRWDTIAFRLPPRAEQVAPQAWTWLRTPRSCPRCTQEDGYRRLEWSIPWILTCTKHRSYLCSSTDTNRALATEIDIAHTLGFQALLDGHSGQAAGYRRPPLEVFDTWRDAISIARRTRSWGVAPRHEPRELSALISHLAPFVNAASPDQAAAVLLQWCRTGGVLWPYGSLLGRVRTRQAQDAIDAVCARWNRDRRPH
jgi:hypothetical protein